MSAGIGARAFGVSALGWGLVGWGAAASLALRNDYGLWGALTWAYAVRAGGVGLVLGAISAPALAAPLGFGLPIRLPTRAALAVWLGLGAQRGVIGLILAVLGTFALLYAWPNEMQNERIDALKWTGFFWTSHRDMLLPASVGGGIGIGWISARLCSRPDPSGPRPAPGDPHPAPGDH